MSKEVIGESIVSTNMKLRKLLKIVLGLLVLFVVAIGITSINHPIIFKWVTGSARHLGQPMSATVYTNGQINDRIKVFYADEGNGYLVSLAEYDSMGMLRFISINVNENWIGKAAATSILDYDFIAGHLFQSETGGRFTP